MSRPRCKGSTIGVQLPLSVDVLVRGAADQAGLSPGLFVADVVGRLVVSGGLGVGFGTWAADDDEVRRLRIERLRERLND